MSRVVNVVRDGKLAMFDIKGLLSRIEERSLALGCAGPPRPLLAGWSRSFFRTSYYSPQ